MRADDDTYTHGHDAAVLRSHTSRTVSNSAAYLRPHLEADQRLLDVGCGPATITAEFAAVVGEVIAIETNDDILGTARSTVAAAGVEVDLRLGDVYALDFADDAFDVVHAHQVLQHLSDPVAALREMRRVCRPGGFVACRDSDYGAFTWAPAEPLLDRWIEVYHAVTADNRAEADAGRYLRSWALAAGFDDVTTTASVWAYTSDDERRWWAELWADRISPASTLGRQAVDYGHATESELAEIGDAFRRWATVADGAFFVPCGEILCRP